MGKLMIGFVSWKLLRRTLVPYQESYVELAACLAVFFFAFVCVAIKKRRQFWRHVVQTVSLLVFFFVISSCLGVFGLIRNAFHGASLIGKDDLNAFYFLSMTVVIISVAFHSGAVFCGWICPTGSLQELVSKTRRLVQRRKTYILPPKGVLLAVLAGAMVVFLCVVYRVFSKRRPFPEDSAVLWAVSLIVIVVFAMFFPKRERVLKTFRAISLALIVFSILVGISVYSPVHFVFSNVHDWASMLSTLVIMLSGIWVARAWCRYLCPFGYLCSQLNRVALRRVIVSRECSGCNRCGKVCEVGAIEKGRINQAACIMCLACVDACPSGCVRLIQHGRGVT
jgi:polyferredoxin